MAYLQALEYFRICMFTKSPKRAKLTMAEIFPSGRSVFFFRLFTN
jgi:hypothetical protein